jgi:phage minor structural protein
MKLKAILENAFNIGYEEINNGLWTAGFSLPSDDPKNAECQPFRFVEVFDNGERVELFRIVPTTQTDDDSTSQYDYQCEHVLATLLDDVMFRYHQIDNFNTATVIDFILDKQTVQRWQVGQVDFNFLLSYKWENENLLSALFSVPKQFVDEYEWTWNTTTTPWTLNLKAADMAVSAYIRYAKNRKSIKRIVDPTKLVTRIYPLGYGEGVNQLGIESVNPTGQPYIDSDTVATYGIVARTWVDRRYEKAQALFNDAKALLEYYKHPFVSYEIEAAELYTLTSDPLDKFAIGKRVRVIDEEFGADFIERVVRRVKSDVVQNPADVQLELSNRTLDSADIDVSVIEKQQINDLYAQGATNIDSHDFADNCDPANPAILKVYIPTELVRINKMIMNYEVNAFRAYSKSALDGGGSTITSEGGGGSTVTSAGGGGASITSNATAANNNRFEGATYDGNGNIITGAIEIDFQSGGGEMVVPLTQALVITVSDGGHTHSTDGTGTHNHGGAAGSHNHGNPDNQNTAPSINSDGFHSHTAQYAGDHTHGVVIDHTHNVRYHSHKIDHQHFITLPNHTHDVTLPNHTHDVDIPDHTHELEYGIFLKPETPTAVTIEIDGNVIPGVTSINGSDINIIPYLSKDGEGKIERGTWHEIKITPNNLGRVEVNVYKQIFVQSRGSGDF